MWLVKTQTIGSAVSSVTVTGAFTTDYDNYIITISGGAGSAAGVLNMKLGSSANGHYYSFTYSSYNAVTASTGNTNVATFDYVGSHDSTGIRARIEVLSPQLAKATSINAVVQNSTFYAGTCNGLQTSTTQYTAFTLAPSSGTLTGGTIRIYGYRN